MKIRNLITTGLVLCGLFVSACGSDTNKAGHNSDPDLITQLMSALLGTLKPKSATTDVRKTITRQAIDAASSPLLLVSIETRNAHATLSPIGENHGIITWSTADGVSLSFNHGILVATRGLGPDLMAADINNALPAVQSGGGTAMRLHDYLDGEGQIRQRKFQCAYESVGREELEIYDIKVTANHVVETCDSSGLKIMNHYWVSGYNRIRQSRQWIGSDIGYAFIQHLSR